MWGIVSEKVLTIRVTLDTGSVRQLLTKRFFFSGKLLTFFISPIISPFFEPIWSQMVSFKKEKLAEDAANKMFTPCKGFKKQFFEMGNSERNSGGSHHRGRHLPDQFKCQ